MKLLDATNMNHQILNNKIRESNDSVSIINCLGQRYIAAGQSQKQIHIQGTPGNALGAYLDGAKITVYGNAQDAVGDTMNDGEIVIHGNVGDVVGYAMRGGKIFVKGDAGYRAGIHMKEYQKKCPVVVIGGTCGSFLGEYQAGGVLLILGLHSQGKEIIGDYPCMGMHGGKLFLRSACNKVHWPMHVNAREATQEDLKEIEDSIIEFCKVFSLDKDYIMKASFTVVTPNTSNPYKQMYVAN